MEKFLIGDFEGPLDLLLHLVKQSKIDINQLSLVEITEQYINFINKMQELNLNIASSYLVIAAELIEMKSRFLLPKPPKEDNEETYENPEEELKRRLLEYQKYKNSVSSFRTLESNRSNYYTKTPEKRETYTNEKLENTENITAYDLLVALQKLLERKEYSKPLNTKITKKELSVNDRIAKIRNVLKKEKRINFLNLFEELTRPYIVVTFLSILEMAKNGEITLKQEGNFENIILERVD